MRTAKTTSYRRPQLFFFVPQGDSGILVSDVGRICAKTDGRFRRILIVIHKTPVCTQKTTSYIRSQLHFRYPRCESGAFASHFVQICPLNLPKFLPKSSHLFPTSSQNYSQLFDTCFASHILLFNFPRCESGALAGILFKYVHQNIPKFFSKSSHFFQNLPNIILSYSTRVSHLIFCYLVSLDVNLALWWAFYSNMRTTIFSNSS